MKSRLSLAGISGVLLVFSLVLSGCPPAATTPTVTSVTVSPATANVAKGGTHQFTATVTGDNSPAQTVTWTVTGGGAGTTISTSGLLTVAAAETATTLTVTATSTVDTSKSGTATVTVTGGGGSGVTFTGIDSQYNGQYAVFRSSSSTPPTGAGDYLLGGSDPTIQGITGVQISNGSVTIPVYLLNSKAEDPAQALIGPYDGSDKNITIRVLTKNEPSFTYQDVFEEDEDFTVNSVDFTNGSATVTVTGGNDGGDGGGGSGVTFTGIDSLYNGQYAVFRSSSSTPPTGAGDYLLGGSNPTVQGITGVQISNGSVTIPVYLLNSKAQDPAQALIGPYSGSDKNITIRVFTKNGPSFTYQDVFEDNEDFTVDSVNFINGAATVTVNAATGSITFTGIDSQYNGQYAVFRSASDTSPTGGEYLGGAGAFSMSDGTMTITGVQISGGSVTIPAYLGNTDGTSAPYSGSDKNIKIYLSIKNSSTFTSDEMQNDTHRKYTIASVNFTNGTATVTVNAPPPSTNSGTLTITEISSITGELPDGISLMIGIFPTETTLEEALLQTGIVAGARGDNGDVTLSESTATCSLYSAPFESGDRWTDSGTYNVYLVVLLGEVVNEEVVNEGGMIIYQAYQAQNVSFTSGTATISAESFSEVSSPIPE
jgi:hypothetical protein